MSEGKRKVRAPIMGVREWAVGNDGSLNSTGIGEKWEPRKAQHAVCKRTGDLAMVMEHYRFMTMTTTYGTPSEERRLEELRREIQLAENGGHPAPHKSCACGLYAFYSREACEEHGDGVAKEMGVRGVVSAWGGVIRCEHGFRAEYMKLEAVIQEDKNLKRDFWTAHATAGPAYKALADKHGVPLIRPEEVSAFVQLSGGTVLQPDPQPQESMHEIAEREVARARATMQASVRASNTMSRDLARAKADIRAVKPPLKRARPHNAMSDPTDLFLLLLPVLVVLIVSSLLLSLGG